MEQNYLPKARPKSSANFILLFNLLSRQSLLVSSGSSGSAHTRPRLAAQTFTCEILAKNPGLIQIPSNA